MEVESGSVTLNRTGEVSPAGRQQAPTMIKPSSPPHSPPPAYASLPPLADPYAPPPSQPGRPGSAASTSSSQTIHAPLPPQLPPTFPSTNGLYTPIPSQPPTATHQHAFGPTPLPLALPHGGLPYAYYEPVGAADTRARRRFLRAFLLGFGIYFLFISALGLEFYGEMA
ncbi:hypothetical protein D9619_000560 [Psilocybe cf. subviscida]|uniref:Uncharacterized protein n=1 Tax=Psilocybe cf. subviscida TaxID=2480587 RepID=A0A8H5BEQ5_9AGAR|nr:hypothetical protein D9619_000560 [Psilocybe cf. subviscida]